jgi:hypothetical protein
MNCAPRVASIVVLGLFAVVLRAAAVDAQSPVARADSHQAAAAQPTPADGAMGGMRQDRPTRMMEVCRLMATPMMGIAEAHVRLLTDSSRRPPLRPPSPHL